MGEHSWFVMRVVVLLCLAISLVADAERLWEQGREHRVHDHHRHEFHEERDDGQEEEEEEHSGGIQVVEDDVPEWVKLTFADKFIVMGETDFIELGDEDVEKPDYSDDMSEIEHHHHHHHHHHHEDEEGDKHDDGDYEYVYSDEEGFEFDPSRDKLVYDPHKPTSTSASIPSTDDSADLEEDDHEADMELVNAVKAHRAIVDSQQQSGPAQLPRQHTGPVSIPLNTPFGAPPAPAHTTALLELEETISVVKGKSHARGSRRAQAGKFATKTNSHHQLGQPTAPFSPSDVSNIEHPAHPKHHITSNLVGRPTLLEVPSRYATAGGQVKLNKRDPRFKRFEDEDEEQDDGNTATSFVEEDSKNIPLAEDSKDTAKNHREWLEKFPTEKEVKLPSLKRYMYSSGLPVNDWEVKYVDNVLKQFGY